MSEHPYTGDRTTQLEAAIGSPEFRRAMAATGITAAEAAKRLHAAAQHFDLDAFEALIAVHRPALWKRMNKKPSRLHGVLRRLVRA